MPLYTLYSRWMIFNSQIQKRHLRETEKNFRTTDQSGVKYDTTNFINVIRLFLTSTKCRTCRAGVYKWGPKNVNHAFNCFAMTEEVTFSINLVLLFLREWLRFFLA